jgi:hypothetical protein
MFANPLADSSSVRKSSDTKKNAGDGARTASVSTPTPARESARRKAGNKGPKQVQEPVETQENPFLAFWKVGHAKTRAGGNGVGEGCVVDAGRSDNVR